MTPKTEYKKLVAIVKKELMKKGEPNRHEDISNTLGYNRSYFSAMLGGRYIITEDHVKLLKLHYPFLDTTEKKRDVYEILLSIEKKLDRLLKK